MTLDFFKIYGPRKKPRYAVSAKKRALLIERDGLVCAYCRVELRASEVTVDHIKPKTKGGGNELSNLTICCRPCNSSKGNRAAPYPRARL